MMKQIKEALENKAGWYEAVKGDTYNVWYGTGVLAVRVFCGEEFAQVQVTKLASIINEWNCIPAIGDDPINISEVVKYLDNL